MKNSRGEKKMVRWACGLAGGVAAAALLASLAFCVSPPILLPPLAPVDAPLAPALPGQRFAPEAVPSALVPAGGAIVQELPPQSTGTHVTATLLRAKTSTRLVAVWGDPVLWEQSGGKTWRPAPDLPRLTGDAPEVVVLEEKSGQVIVGTRREGWWGVQNGAWKPMPRANAPYDANAQALGAYRSALYAATLNDGLVVRDGRGVWRHVAPPVISTLAPRQFVIWHDVLYVRHGNGMVDTWNGRTWTTNVFAKLPRSQVFALQTSANGDALLLAQWSGWSQTRDGKTWTFHFPPELKNVPLTALLPTKNALFVGTQGRGLVECDPNSGAVRKWHDERGGISDDWITTLSALPGEHIAAGTFVDGAFSSGHTKTSPAQQAGLYQAGLCQASLWQAGLWQPVAGTQNDCVTGAATTAKAAYICLRRGGVWRIDGIHPAAQVSPLPEAQCVLPDAANHLLWVGTRTGIYTVAE